MMANAIYNALGGQAQQAQTQNPRTAAMERIKSMGISIPQGMENDPNALLQHVLQSGKVPPNRLSMAQQVMGRLIGRR